MWTSEQWRKRIVWEWPVAIPPAANLLQPLKQPLHGVRLDQELVGAQHTGQPDALRVSTGQNQHRSARAISQRSLHRVIQGPKHVQDRRVRPAGAQHLFNLRGAAGLLDLIAFKGQQLRKQLSLSLVVLAQQYTRPVTQWLLHC